jgi:hypothetical protein
MDYVHIRTPKKGPQAVITEASSGAFLGQVIMPARGQKRTRETKKGVLISKKDLKMLASFGEGFVISSRFEPVGFKDPKTGRMFNYTAMAEIEGHDPILLELEPSTWPDVNKVIPSKVEEIITFRVSALNKIALETKKFHKEYGAHRKKGGTHKPVPFLAFYRDQDELFALTAAGRITQKVLGWRILPFAHPSAKSPDLLEEPKLFLSSFEARSIAAYDATLIRKLMRAATLFFKLLGYKPSDAILTLSVPKSRTEPAVFSIEVNGFSLRLFLMPLAMTV